MLLTTQYKNEPLRYYSYETDEQYKEALLAIMKNGWKNFPTSRYLEVVSTEAVRHHFSLAEWEMATLKDSIFNDLPSIMKSEVAAVKQRVLLLMNYHIRRFNTMTAARELIQTTKKDALALTTVVDGKEKSSIIVVAEDLDELLYSDYLGRLFSVQRTESY